MEAQNSFRILSIDGGGIRGLFPAYFLSQIENSLRDEGKDEWKIYNYFDLICGTSTGGIIAIGLGLGMPASKIAELYNNHARDIFGKRKNFFRRILDTKHDNQILENLLKNYFSEYTNVETPKLGHSKTRLCIPVYDLVNGEPNILKTSHHERLIRDYRIPAYQAAMATASAPTYFKPYDINCKDSTDNESYPLKVDGGVYANNPALIGIIEAMNGLNINPERLKVLSLGTGTRKFRQHQFNKKWGLKYWMSKSRMLELFFQAQSDNIERLVKVMNEGLGKNNSSQFYYKRIQKEFSTKEESIKMDESKPEKLKSLKDAASYLYRNNGDEIRREFFRDSCEKYKPYKEI
ncbi:MAG: CBASS cGAMP-activated phospholipase [bacterium]